jgi:hypothetical protein
MKHPPRRRLAGWPMASGIRLATPHQLAGAKRPLLRLEPPVAREAGGMFLVGIARPARDRPEAFPARAIKFGKTRR